MSSNMQAAIDFKTDIICSDIIRKMLTEHYASLTPRYEKTDCTLIVNLYKLVCSIWMLIVGSTWFRSIEESFN